MSDYARCETCGAWTWLSRHTCPPEWEWQCQYVHDADGWDTVRALDAEQAAEKAAEQYDRNEYPLCQSRSEGVEIKIRDPRSGEVTRWHAYAELEPHYYATPIEAR